MNSVVHATCIETLSATAALQVSKFLVTLECRIKLAKLCSKDEIL